MNTKNTDGYIFEGAFPSIFCWTVVDIQAKMLNHGIFDLKMTFYCHIEIKYLTESQ